MKEPSPSCRPQEHNRPARKDRKRSAASRDRAARIFRALGDAPRLRLLELLDESEWCVTELVEALGEKFSTVSQRLRLLRTEGLVRRRREGTHIIYALADRHVAGLIRNALDHAEELEARPAREDDVAQEGEGP